MTAATSRPWRSRRSRPRAASRSPPWPTAATSAATRFSRAKARASRVSCPKPLTSSGTKRGLFTRQDFVYDAEHDHYTCPAGAKLTKANRRADHTEDFDFYRHLSACFTCPLRPRCTPTKLRRIKRWENEDVLDRMQDRLDRMPEAMGVRRQTVEHPFGTLKAWMGATHFLTRTLDKVRTEMSLHVLAYNLKRMITIFGVGPLMAAIRA